MARYLRTINHHSDLHTYLLCPPLAVINLTVQRKSLTRFCCVDVGICAYSATRAVLRSVDDVFRHSYLSYRSLVGLRLGLCARVLSLESGANGAGTSICPLVPAMNKL